MTRSIAVVGAGQAGLQLAIGLLEKGFAVTLVAERSADEVFHGRLTATAGLFATALSYEEELGLDLWAGEAPLIDGVHIDFCIEQRNLPQRLRRPRAPPRRLHPLGPAALEGHSLPASGQVLRHRRPRRDLLDPLPRPPRRAVLQRGHRGCAGHGDGPLPGDPRPR